MLPSPPALETQQQKVELKYMVLLELELWGPLLYPKVRKEEYEV